jgi:hypothetical protein
LEEEDLMPRGIWIVFFLLLIPWTLAAQDKPLVEIFGGYSHFWMPSGFAPDYGRDYTTERASLNGWNVTAKVNLNRWVGIDADFGGYYGKAAATYSQPFVVSYARDFSIGTYLFGPRFSYRGNRRLTLFSHALLGMVVLARLPIFNTSKSSFCQAYGGGLDINLAKHVAIRAMQADYVRSSLSSKGENNFRLSTGLVFRF